MYRPTEQATSAPTRAVQADQRAGERSARWGRFWRGASPYLYLAPALIFIVIFVYLPLARTVQISFYEWNLVRVNQNWVGLDNYAYLLSGDFLPRLLVQSAAFLLIAVFAIVALPIALAFLTLQLSKREISFYQSALFFPTVIASSVAVLVWVWFFLPTRSGLFNTAVRVFNPDQPPIQWLTDSFWAMPAVSLVANWKQMGFHYLIALAGLKAIPRDYLEAAYVDGARGWSLMRRIVLPMFAPTGLFLFVITLIQGLEHVFIPIEVMTQGGPAGGTNNLMYGIYQEGFKYFRAGIASALSVILIVLFGGLVFWQYRLLDRRITYER